MGNKLDKAIRLLEKIIESQEKLIAAAEAGANGELYQNFVCASQEKLHQQLCAEMKLIPVGGINGSIIVETPFCFPDGDPYKIYLKKLPTGNLRMSDYGHTLMHLSYEHDIEKLLEEIRGKVVEKCLGALSMKSNDGEIFIDFPLDKLGITVVRFGQAIAMIYTLAERGAD